MPSAHQRVSWVLSAVSNEELKPQEADERVEAAVDAYREWEAAKWDGEQYASEREARRLVVAIRDALQEAYEHRLQRP